MAHVKILRQDSVLNISSQAFYLKLKDTWANRGVLFVLLRALCCPQTGKPLFTYQQLADVFGYTHWQNIQNFVQEFEKCTEDFTAYLRRHRKVDATVVEAVTAEMRRAPLIPEAALCARVAILLERGDLMVETIHAALEQVPCTVIRRPLRHEWESGRFHPKEAIILEQALTALLDTALQRVERMVEEMQVLGISAPETDEALEVRQHQAQSVAFLLNPSVLVSEVSWRIRLVVLALTLYFWNVPLSRISMWFGVSKGMVYQWVSGLAVGLFPIIQDWIVLSVKAVGVIVDEKWLKIRKQWHY